LWLVDITEHRTDGVRLYCCATKDVFSNGIVDYSIADRMESQLTVTLLRNAVVRRGDVAGCVIHSDRGPQFRSRKFVAALRYYGMVGSMGRVGAAGDNAAMESFFTLLQKNVLNGRRWATCGELRIAIVTCTAVGAKSARPVDPNRIRDDQRYTGQSGRANEIVT